MSSQKFISSISLVLFFLLFVVCVLIEFNLWKKNRYIIERSLLSRLNIILKLIIK